MTRPNPWALLRAWIAIGTQSIGGGPSTLFMMRRIVVERQQWVTLRHFTESYALSQLSPGIHFVALAGLLGRSIDGPRGVALSVAGMMIPAAAITAVMTAFFSRVADHPLTVAALSGIGPVAAGMTIGLAITLARPVLRRGRVAILDAALIVASFGLLIGGASTPVAVILVAGGIGALLLGGRRPTSADAPMS